MKNKAAVNAAIDQALKEFGRSNPTRRHPADVTADRLGEASVKFDFTPAERGAISVVIDALRRFGSGE